MWELASDVGEFLLKQEPINSGRYLGKMLGTSHPKLLEEKK